MMSSYIAAFACILLAIARVEARNDRHLQFFSAPRSCEDYMAVDDNNNCLYTGCKGPAAGGQCFYCGTSCSNGCGPEGYGALVPDKLLFGFFGDFSSACCRHDMCIRSIIKKEKCIAQFREDMYAVCADYGSVKRPICRLAAKAYYQAVKSVFSGRYRRSQEKRKAYEQSPACRGSDAIQKWNMMEEW